MANNEHAAVAAELESTKNALHATRKELESCKNALSQAGEQKSGMRTLTERLVLLSIVVLAGWQVYLTFQLKVLLT